MGSSYEIETIILSGLLPPPSVLFTQHCWIEGRVLISDFLIMDMSVVKFV